MKTPLGYQISEYDCGAVSLLNAISFLFDREDIPAAIIKAINTYTLDSKDEKGNIGAHGTSKEAMTKFVIWLNEYASSFRFNVKSEKLENEKVSIKKIKECINNNGCAVARSYLKCEHYILITKIDKKYVYVFDPYYLDKKNYKESSDTKIILNKPYDYNRKIKMKRFRSENQLDFALGEISKRECILIYKK